MNILSVNTATDAMGVGVYGPTGCHEWTTPPQAAGRGHSEALVPVVDAVLRQAGLRVTDLGGVAVVVGPGGFTGVRAGLVFARTLAHARGIPVAGVDTLEALAGSVGVEGQIVTLLDARRGMVFSARWEVRRGVRRLLRPARLESLEELIGALDGGPCTFVGEGALVHRITLEALPGAHVPSDVLHAVRPAVVAELARSSLQAGGESPLDLQPRYLRAPAMAREVTEEPRKEVRP
ncbi:MAG: tRNA (adenosine(37)-N6)-threonylcarbamoyltransferase complex dimerization subunit type 1 TsaB [Candidatus Sericytochromatia bacterium]|nr:tRNA (adenosine(37)-N6)-threonylcarbamoyltransferase complex dimerization subunit type 1 TsaB [Candidatus Sericytochromatia bacterium]